MVIEMNVNYDYYRMFYYVAKYGSITKAADFLLYNQPNVTRTIKLLEKELGCVLFDRTNRGVTLTKQGEKLYEHIKIAVSHIELAEKEIGNEKEMESGIVSIGTTDIALRCYLLPILNKFHTQYPNIKINISNYTTRQSINALQNGLVDFSVVTTPIEKINGLKFTCMKTLNEVAVCGNNFKKLHTGKHSLKELAEYPIIMMDKTTTSYELYKNIFTQNRIDFSPTIETATADQIIPMVKNNLGVGFVAEELLNENSKDVFKINVLEALPQRTISVVEKTNSNKSFAVERFFEIIFE